MSGVCDLLAPFFRTWLAVDWLRTGPGGAQADWRIRGRGVVRKAGCGLLQGPLHILQAHFCLLPPRNCWPAPKHPSTRDGGGSAVVVIIHRRASSAGVRSRADTDKARAPNEAPTRHPGERGLGKRSSNRAHHLHSPHQHVTPWQLANPLHGLTCPGKGVQSAGPVIGCWTCCGRIFLFISGCC